MPSVSKIIHVLTDHNVGGAGVFLCRLLSHPILKEGSLVLLPTGSLLCASLSARGISYATFPMKKSRSFSPSAVVFFRNFFKETPTRLVVSHASLSARIAAKSLRLPAISVRHCDTPLSRFPAFLYNALTDLTVATSQSAAARLRKAGVRAVRTVENAAEDVGVPTAEMRKQARKDFGIPDGKTAIGLVGRLSPIKGQETAILALSLLAKREQEKILLCFLGEGEERERLSDTAARLAVAHAVRFCGYREDVRPFYHAMDAHLSCSLGSETASLSLGEGLSAALPTLASNIPGNRERLGDGGLFFPAGDAPALSRLFRRLLDSGERARLSSLARRRFSSLPILSDMQAAYCAIFDEFSRELGQNGCIFQKDMLQ